MSHSVATYITRHKAYIWTDIFTFPERIIFHLSGKCDLHFERSWRALL